jgi:DNA primase
VVKVKNYFGLRKDLRLLGEHLIVPGLPLLVVEGLFAFAHLVEIGAREICNPVAPMGSDLSMAQRDLLVSHDAPVFLCFDNDPAGSIGLYGPWNKRDQLFEGNGAIDRLKTNAPTFLCHYPERTDEPDELTLDEVADMLEFNHERLS